MIQVKAETLFKLSKLLHAKLRHDTCDIVNSKVRVQVSKQLNDQIWNQVGIISFNTGEKNLFADNILY